MNATFMTAMDSSVEDGRWKVVEQNDGGRSDGGLVNPAERGSEQVVMVAETRGAEYRGDAEVDRRRGEVVDP
ncbi:unnamed protein product [Camellia sinensis]